MKSSLAPSSNILFPRGNRFMSVLYIHTHICMCVYTHILSLHRHRHTHTHKICLQRQLFLFPKLVSYPIHCSVLFPKHCILLYFSFYSPKRPFECEHISLIPTHPDHISDLSNLNLPENKYFEFSIDFPFLLLLASSEKAKN